MPYSKITIETFDSQYYEFINSYAYYMIIRLCTFSYQKCQLTTNMRRLQTPRLSVDITRHCHGPWWDVNLNITFTPVFSRVGLGLGKKLHYLNFVMFRFIFFNMTKRCMDMSW